MSHKFWTVRSQTSSFNGFANFIGFSGERHLKQWTMGIAYNWLHLRMVFSICVQRQKAWVVICLWLCLKALRFFHSDFRRTTKLWSLPPCLEGARICQVNSKSFCIDSIAFSHTFLFDFSVVCWLPTSQLVSQSVSHRKHHNYSPL